MCMGTIKAISQDLHETRWITDEVLYRGNFHWCNISWSRLPALQKKILWFQISFLHSSETTPTVSPLVLVIMRGNTLNGSQQSINLQKKKNTNFNFFLHLQKFPVTYMIDVPVCVWNFVL